MSSQGLWYLLQKGNHCYYLFRDGKRFEAPSRVLDNVEYYDALVKVGKPKQRDYVKVRFFLKYII